jgi:polar amino acid transport system permease protein
MEELTNFWPNILFILEGIKITLQYSIFSVIFGFMIGVLIAIGKIAPFKFLNIICYGYTSIFRGTPLLIQLSIIYFGIPTILPQVNFGVFAAGIIAFSLNSGAYVSEIIRAGIASIDPGQKEAAKILGIPPLLMFKDIILPQAIKYILPALVNELINLIKESAIISVIGEMDLMRRAQIVSAETYSVFIPMLTAAAAYYIMVFIVSNVALLIEKRLNK